MVVVAEQFKGITAAQAGRYLKLRRGKLPQEQFGERIGVNTKVQISYFETGKIDWRRSKYAGAIMQELSITAEDARTHLGIETLISPISEGQSIAGQKVQRIIQSSVKAPLLGVVQAVDNKFKKVASQKIKPQMVEVPPSLVKGIPIEEVFVLKVNGESMCDDEARNSIPEGYMIACRTIEEDKRGYLNIRKGQIVVAWIKDFPDTEDGLGVLKVYTGQTKKDDTVLDSYNRKGLRFKVSDYNMIIQAVVLGAWKSFS